MDAYPDACLDAFPDTAWEASSFWAASLVAYQGPPKASLRQPRRWACNACWVDHVHEAVLQETAFEVDLQSADVGPNLVAEGRDTRDVVALALHHASPCRKVGEARHAPYRDEQDKA